MKPGELLDKMLLLATTAHHGQFDKGGNPYILHPLAVMSLLHTQDEELMCIALGHDLLEDTDVTSTTLQEANMTPRIITAIDCLTRAWGEDYSSYKERVFSNNDAMLVKLADLEHNCDIKRLKGVTKRDNERVAKYHAFYMEIKSKLV